MLMLSKGIAAELSDVGNRHEQFSWSVCTSTLFCFSSMGDVRYITHEQKHIIHVYYKTPDTVLIN